MRSGTTGFMKYVYYRAKARYGKDYRNMIQEAIFKHNCYRLRGKQKRFIDILIECDILSEEESKAPKILSSFRKAKEDKLKIESQKTEVDKVYDKYRHLVQYFVHQYGIGRLPISHAINHDDIIHDCWFVILQNVDFTKFCHKAIIAYIAKTVRTQCVRSCSRMLHIRIPDHIFHVIRYANRRPEHEDSWKILASPGNRFVVPLEDNVDIAIQEEENFQYEHLKDILSEMLDKLSAKERFILKHRFGVGPEKKTLEEIGVILQCTRERVRQIEEILIRKLRCWMITAKELSDDEREQLRSLPSNYDEFIKTHGEPDGRRLIVTTKRFIVKLVNHKYKLPQSNELIGIQ